MMTRNEVNFQIKSKHVRVRYDFLREQVADGKVVFRYLSTELQLADAITNNTININQAAHRGKIPLLQGLPLLRGPQALHGRKAHATSSTRGVLGIRPEFPSFPPYGYLLLLT